MSPPLRPKGRNRKLWKDEGRWEHDRFREEEQAPKSREELVSIYGYDIRNGGGTAKRPYRQRRPRSVNAPPQEKMQLFFLQCFHQDFLVFSFWCK